ARGGSCAELPEATIWGRSGTTAAKTSGGDLLKAGPMFACSSPRSDSRALLERQLAALATSLDDDELDQLRTIAAPCVRDRRRSSTSAGSTGPQSWVAASCLGEASPRCGPVRLAARGLPHARRPTAPRIPRRGGGSADSPRKRRDLG